MKILIDVPIQEEALARLKSVAGREVHCIVPPGEKPRELDPSLLADVEVLFCSTPPKNFREMNAIRWVQIASSGYAQLFEHDLPSRGIRATNALGCFDIPIAEWVMAMLVNLARNIRQMIRNQEAAVWDRSAVFQREIRGLTLGLWGYGGIGRETARLAKHMGLRVHVLTRHGVGPRKDAYYVPGTGDPDGVLPDKVFKSGEEMEFLSKLDFLVVALPLTKNTDGLIGRREIAGLPRTAFILNPSRGSIIQQDALLEALRENRIAGAALDAHYHYPMPSDHPLWKFPNVILTPHISGSSLSPRFKERIWEIFLLNVERYEQGGPLLNELTPAQLAGE